MVKHNSQPNLSTSDVPVIATQPRTYIDVEEWLGETAQFAHQIGQGHYEALAAPLRLLSSYGPANAQFPWTRRLYRIFALLQRACLGIWLSAERQIGDLSGMLARADLAVLNFEQDLQNHKRSREAHAHRGPHAQSEKAASPKRICTRSSVIASR